MIGTCPECSESIRIPQGTADQQVRCPLCSEEYPLEKVLGGLPPMLELIGSGVGPIEIESEFSELSVRSESDGKPASRKRGYTPQKRREINMFAEIVKVVLGGLLAIPIGLLCVWWFAGRAPFGVAESVGKYIPWVVPAKLRGGDLVDGDVNDDFEKQPNERQQNGSGKAADRRLKEGANRFRPGTSKQQFPGTEDEKGEAGSNSAKGNPDPGNGIPKGGILGGGVQDPFLPDGNFDDNGPEPNAGNKSAPNSESKKERVNGQKSAAVPPKNVSETGKGSSAKVPQNEEPKTGAEDAKSTEKKSTSPLGLKIVPLTEPDEATKQSKKTVNEK